MLCALIRKWVSVCSSGRGDCNLNATLNRIESKQNFLYFSIVLAGIEGSSQGYWGSRKCGKRGIEIVGHVDYIQEADNKVESV